MEFPSAIGHPLLRAAGVALVLALQPGPARAAAPAAGASGLAAELEAQVRSLARVGGPAGLAGVTRVEVAVGQLDPRLRLAACAHVEPFLPHGTRLWGRSRIGLRCVDGAVAWKVFLPVTVKAFGRGLVAGSAVAPGSVLRAGDLVEGEVDLAEDRSAAVTDPAQAVGRTLAQPLAPGQSVRVAHLKARQWFAAGDTVKLIAVGAGFSLEGEGQALSNGIEGQPARVRTENGRVLTGRPVGTRRLELAL